MAREGKKTITIDEEFADELEQYGDTRDEQVEKLLVLAQTRGGAGEDSSDLDEVMSQLISLEDRLSSIPNQADVRAAAEVGARSAVEDIRR